MVAASIDGVKLKQAIGEFGSLEKAIDSLKHQIETLSKQRNKLKQENEALGLSKNKLIAGIHDLNNKFDDQKTKLQLLAESFGKWERQYNLFQSFLCRYPFHVRKGFSYWIFPCSLPFFVTKIVRPYCLA